MESKVVTLCLSVVQIIIIPHIQFPMRKGMNREAKQIQNGKVRIITVPETLHMQIKYQ